MFRLYILYDEDRGKYYIGQTANLADRLARHIQKRSKYTRTGDWKLVYTEDYPTRSEAVRRESYLKKLKDKALIEKLVRASR